VSTFRSDGCKQGILVHLDRCGVCDDLWEGSHGPILCSELIVSVVSIDLYCGPSNYSGLQ
jgi:hypothetical protein